MISIEKIKTDLSDFRTILTVQIYMLSKQKLAKDGLWVILEYKTNHPIYRIQNTNKKTTQSQQVSNVLRYV